MPTERIRVLRVTEQAILGGEQTDVLHLLTHLDPARYEQVLSTEPSGPLVDEARRVGIPHVPVTMRHRFDVAAIYRLRQIMYNRRYDIVHLHGARAGLLGRIAARFARVPLTVWTMHLFQADVLHGWRRWQVPLYLFVEGILARYFCAAIITVSEDLRRRTIALERVPADKILTIYSYVDLSLFENLWDPASKRLELGLPVDVPVVCSVGRLCAGKGVSDFLHAAASVHAQMPSVHFLVVGDGPLRCESEALSRQLGLDGSLTFLGYRNDVAGILCASDVFATATHWEGFGKVNVEAMAAAKPLVATQVGAIPEVVGDYRGAILVSPHNPQVFAKALLTILSDLPTYRRWGKEGRQRAYAQFGQETLARHTSELYERLIVERWPERLTWNV